MSRPIRSYRFWHPALLLAWMAVVVFTIVDTGTQKLVHGQPFAESWGDIAGFAWVILPGVVLTSLAFCALHGLLRPGSRLGTKVVVCTGVGVAYWIGWSLVEAGLVHYALHPARPPVGFAEHLPRSLGSWLLPSLTLYAVIVALLAASRSVQEAHAQSLRALRLQTELSAARMRTLSAQLDPHFLYNTLHVVSALMRRQAGVAKALLADLSGLLHASLAQSDRSTVRLEEEVRLVERYVAIQKARFGDRLSVEIAIAPETLSVPVPRLLLQPLVENAVQHGTSRSVQGGWVRIRAEKRRRRVVISVINSGPATAQDSPLPREGIGIGGIRARLSLLFGDTASISFSRPADGQFLARIDLPAHPLTSLPPQDLGSQLASREPRGDTAAGTAAFSGYWTAQPFPGRHSSHPASPVRRVGDDALHPWIWAAAWCSVVAAYAVVIGLERMAVGLPFAESLLQIVRRAAMVLPAALFSPLVLLASKRIRSQPRATGEIVLAYSAVGVAYWIAWTLTLYGLHLTGFFPGPRRSLGDALVFSAHFSFAVYAAQLLVFEAIRHVRESRRREIDVARLHLELSQTEAAAFRARLNPAFLFSTFRLVAGLMDRDIRRARRVLADLSELLRASLARHTEDRWIALRAEFQLLERYLAIQQVRLGRRLAVDTEIARNAQATRVPPLLLQPLAEAIIQWSTGDCVHEGCLRSSARCTRDDVHVVMSGEGCRCASGPPLDAEQQDVFTMMRTRLAALYGEGAGLEVTFPVPGRITIELTLPRVPAPLPEPFMPEKPALPAMQT